VLQNFDAEDMLWVPPLLDAVAEALPMLVKGDAPAFMTRVALILKPPPPKPPRPAEEKEG
jgi:PTH1 family peptidyl-tRNA hydrolase